jgi:ATP-dependent helicase HrpB
MQALPIDPHLPAIVKALRAAPNLVLVAEPGAGKTTRLPRALLDAGFAEHGEIAVLEPRRIAARMAARRVADELGEPVGRRVGYQVRFEDVSSRETRVRFVTEGVLTRRLIADPELRGVAAVLLDEFHERHLQGDLALALLRRLQRMQRPELRLCVMSATLQAEPVARFLGCEVVNVPGRRFDVAIEYDDKPDDRPLPQRVASAARRLVRDGHDGDALVFLPGAAEIRRAREALEPLAKQADLELALLHGDLPPAEQDRALARSNRRKLILSTNVAESSLTIEGVGAVIDSGLARMAGHSPWSGLPTLTTAKISRASAAQRAGRAGRVRAGRCLRLYTRHDHDARPAHDKPEIARADLCETLLAVKAIEAASPDPGAMLGADDWLEPPPAEARRAAEELAALLGALDAHGRPSELGRRMLRIPLHPRLARVLLEADQRGMGRSGCLLAALLSERDIARRSRARFQDRGAGDVETGPSDALERLERFEQAEAAGWDAGRLRALELDPGAVRAVARTRDRLLRSVAPGEHAHDGDQALLMAVLAGFGDRVARRRAPGQGELVLARGGSVVQSEESVVRDAQWLVVLDASEQRARAVAHLLSAIEPEWLLELFPERVLDRTELRFDPRSERIEAAHTLRYDGLLLDESRRAAERGPEAEALLHESALARGPETFADEPEALERFERRVAHAAALSPAIPPLGPDARARALRAACAGKLSFAELREAGLLASLRGLLNAEQLALLERLAPEQVALAHGRRLPVHYEPDRPPWVQSRLQDFFGLRDGPRLGEQPLVLHLLAPNQRAVQVTTDLAGFWQRHYPELRRQLMRRYPKHAWPEDPLTARPPAPGRR